MRTNLIGTKVHQATDDARCPMAGTVSAVLSDELVVVAWDVPGDSIAVVHVNEWLDELVRA